MGDYSPEKAGVGGSTRSLATMFSITCKPLKTGLRPKTISLPEAKNLIVDSKVSLTAYEECVNATSDAERTAASNRHVDSVRRHICELSEKNYHALYGLTSLDFVIMFVPIESAFALAIAHDATLWEEALKKSVLLVSPSTLLFVLRTVAYLWRQEDQARNVQEIAAKGAELYDKLVGFVADLQNIGQRLRQARDSYDQAIGELSTGRGCLDYMTTSAPLPRVHWLRKNDQRSGKRRAEHAYYRLRLSPNVPANRIYRHRDRRV